MTERNWTALAEELRTRIPVHRGLPCIDITVNEERGHIDCAPAGGDVWDYIFDVKDIVTFAEYHNLAVVTRVYPTGAGLQIL